MSVAPLLSTPAQIEHIVGLVSLQRHSRTAVSSQLLAAVHNTSINMIKFLQVPVAVVTLTELCSWFEWG